MPVEPLCIGSRSYLSVGASKRQQPDLREIPISIPVGLDRVQRSRAIGTWWPRVGHGTHTPSPRLTSTLAPRVAYTPHTQLLTRLIHEVCVSFHVEQTEG